MRILVVEDEPELSRRVARALTRHGHDVSSEQNGEAGLQSALADSHDLIVLDINLPGLDGFSILSRMRAARLSTRVLILTARSEIENRVKGLKSGADDYLTKPFAMEELVARIEALGRRGGTTPADVLQVADLHMDVLRRRVTRGGENITLSPREFDLLQVLMEEPGRVFSRTELCERVWQRDHEYDTRTVEIFVARLRKKVDSTFPVHLIHTLRSIGYTIRAKT
jgi:DNA-binding response OmpR family regulator